MDLGLNVKHKIKTSRKKIEIKSSGPRTRQRIFRCATNPSVSKEKLINWTSSKLKTFAL